MSEVTDETLMQYADHTLGAAERARVSQILERDPDARARLAAFMETGRGLAEPYNHIMNAPIPRHLVDVVLGDARPALRARPVRPAAEETIAQRLVRALFGAGEMRLAPAFAAALLMAGGAVGWLVHEQASQRASTGDGVLQLAGGRMLAQGALKTALETAKSGVSVQGSGNDVTLVRLTFKSRSEAFCRQYEFQAAGDTRFTGIGCRSSDGNWQIQFHAPSSAGASAGQKVVPVADAKAVVAGLIDTMSEGDPLERDQEADAIARGWR